MLNFIRQHSAILLAICVLIGFAFPHFSNQILPYLPAVLLLLMTLTTIGLVPRQLIKDLLSSAVWRYALWHGMGVSSLGLFVILSMQLSPAMALAVLAACASGSLFASPAIIASLNMDKQYCMAITVASTIAMPITLLINLALLASVDVKPVVSLDMLAYGRRLLVFIVLPFVLTLIVHRFYHPQKINHVLSQLQPLTLGLIWFFPLGLMGAFRKQFDQNPQQAGEILLVALCVSILVFVCSLLLYWRQGRERAFICAITASNRNVLLTYSVCGAALGQSYLVYMGALQLPIYLLPLIVKLGTKAKLS